MHIQIRTSAWLMRISAVLHGLAILACWLSDLHTFYRLILMSVILGLAYFENRRMKVALTYLRYTGHSGWQVSSDGKNYLDASILGTTAMTNSVIFLHYRTEYQAHQVLLIGKDALANGDFRRLTVRLILSLRGRER